MGIREKGILPVGFEPTAPGFEDPRSSTELRERLEKMEPDGGVAPLGSTPFVLCLWLRTPPRDHRALKLVRHPGTAPGSQAWHARILLLDQCRFEKLI